MTGRIGFDVTAALTQGGGIGRYTRELIRALVNEAPEFAFTLFSAKPPPVLPVPDSLPSAINVRYRPAPVNERWLYRLWFRAGAPLPIQAFTGPIDLYHSPDFVLPPVRGRIPTLLTVHDLSFIHYPETFPPSLVSYLNRVVPQSVQRATHVLADSYSTMKDLQSQWGVPERKVTVLYSGVNDRFRPVKDEAAKTALRLRYHLGDQPIILTVGTVQPRKNYEMLVRAFRRVADAYPHSLVIAGGKGWLEEGLSAEIARQRLESRVCLTGFVDDADLPVLYSAAELFVFPSLYEGFGLPLLEAMACGTPVVTSDSSSLPEVARGEAEDAAIMLSPHDENSWASAMNNLLADDAARQRLVAAGLRRSAQFRWQTAAHQLAHLYHSLLH